MSLRLHLLLDTRGQAKKLLVYDGTSLLGELAPSYATLRVFDGGKPSVLAVEVAPRNFTVETIDSPAKVLLLRGSAGLEEASVQQIGDAELVGYTWSPEGGGALMVHVVKSRYAMEGNMTMAEWEQLVEYTEWERLKEYTTTEGG